METGEGKTVIVTLGNEMRGDDGAGILFGDLIREMTAVPVIQGGAAPENVTGLVIREHPETILIVDAMDFGGKPGDSRFVSCGRLEKDSVSTHGSLKLFTEYLEKMTGSKILILGIQPENITLGTGVSPEVSRQVENLAVKFADTFEKSNSLKMFITSCDGIIDDGE